jgi:hypothetical protein
MKRISATLLLFISGYVCFSQVKNSQINTSDAENGPCKVIFNSKNDGLQLMYEGKTIANIQMEASEGSIRFDQALDTLNHAITQTIKCNGESLKLSGQVLASKEGLAAENFTKYQKAFPIVRTTIGNPSVNLRNNAIYDRYNDWMIEIKINNETLQIVPKIQKDSSKTFALSASGVDGVEIIFRPLFYQQHKGIKYFKP